MSKYSLIFIENNEAKFIDLSSFDFLNGYNLNDIKTIDNFTTRYNNESELLNDLKEKKLISDFTNKLYVYCEKKNEGKIIFDGDILLFSYKQDKLDMNYVRTTFERYKENPKKMLLLTKLYTRKYSEKGRMLSKVDNLFSYANSKIDGSYNASPFSERSVMDSYIESFIFSEFYSKDKNNIKKEKYMSIRDFIIKKMYVDGYFDIERKHSYLSFNYKQKSKPTIYKTFSQDLSDYEDDHEEFLTREDDERTIKEILDNYKSDITEPMIDGNDFIASITKKDLKESLKESINKLILKPGDGDLN